MSLWHRHPGVRSGPDLTVGERAADSMRNGMGSWGFMGAATVLLAVWMVTGAFGFDKPPYFRLNLLLSCFAALQGAILLIAAKRSDQVASEVALHTQGNTDTLLDVNHAQLAILTRLDSLNGQVGDLAKAVQVVMASRAEIAAAERAEVEAVRRAAEDTLTEVRAARKSADAAFAGVQALASVATAKPDRPPPDPPALPAETDAPGKGMGSRIPAKTRGGKM